MSERIKELVEQCGFYLTEKNGQQLYSLVELVVRECAEHIDTLIDDESYLDGEMLLEHFGIEP